MKSCALIVGINEYPPDSAMVKLYGAVADAADFADWVLDPNGGNVEPAHLYFWTYPAPQAPSERLTTYLKTPTAWRLPNTPDKRRSPNFIDITATALSMAQTLPGAGITRMYVFFAGHGVQTVSLQSQIEPQTCLVTGDFWPGGPTTGLVPCEDLRRGLLSNGFAEVVMFLDCCRTPVNFNQPAPALGFPVGPIPDYPYGVGRACRRGTKAFEEPEKHPTSRGAFSRILVEGLRQSRDADGRLTLNDLENYVYAGVSRILAKREPQYPQFDFDPRNPPYVLVTGPAIVNGAPPAPSTPIVVNFGTLARGTKIQLVDSNGASISELVVAEAKSARIPAEAGLYSLETPDKKLVKPFKHVGPGPTHVDL